uniref:Exocyst complex component 2 n=1 Tax=Mesocestoides corti TaxID=53468 RepID=A0A5K3EYC4_MESCO
MTSTGPPAQVTGISPIEGVPGTKLTLRGEHFGQSALDLTHVFVGGIDVSPSTRWFSPRKLSVITPLGSGELEIVIVTRSGGIGTSELTYTQRVGQKVGPQEQVSYWPEDERRWCPAIIERGSGSRQEGGGDVVDASLSATGLPAAELARLSMPLSDTALMKIYPHTGTVLLSEPDFDPMLFLLKYYKNASFEDLVMARNNFSQSISASGAHDSSNVIKNNLYLIFRCLEGLEDLKNEIEKSNIPGHDDYRTSGVKTKSRAKDGTVEMRLEKKLTDSWNQGHDLFKDVLKCRETANSARNVLNIMERFNFLFRLPESIRKTIKQGEYDLAINDYKRAKVLFCSSDCEAFRRVYAEVESVVAQFRDTLKAELLQVPIDVDEAMERIRCLEQLDLDYDPYWVCVDAFKNWLIDQLRCFQKTYQERVPQEASEQASSPVLRSAVKARVGKRQATIQLVKQVCDLLCTHCVQFWRLQSVCSAASRKAPRPASLEGSYGQQSLHERYQMLNIELIHLVASCVREVVLEPSSISAPETVSSGWASTCVQEFRNCCLSLPLDIVPEEAQTVLRRLSHDLRRHAVRDVLRSSQNAIESLYFKENWEVEVTDDGGSITQLPLAYENLVVESLSRCRTLMSPRTSLENSLFDATEYQERFSQSFSDVMVGFLSTLQRLADQIEASLPPQDAAGTAFHNHAGPDAADVDQASSQHAIVAQVRGLLLLVSNADWAARRANSRVFRAYVSAGYSNVDDLKSRVLSAWKTTTDNLVERYTRLRVTWLCAPLDKENTPDSGLQSAIITALCNLSHIHSELVLILGVSRCHATDGQAELDSLFSHRIKAVMKAIAIKLSDSIQARSGDFVGGAPGFDNAAAQVNYILDLLNHLISGDSLEQFVRSGDDLQVFEFHHSLLVIVSNPAKPKSQSENARHSLMTKP